MEATFCSLPGFFQLLDQLVEVPDPAGPGRRFERLPLGQAVDEAFPQVVAVPEKQLSTTLRVCLEHVPDPRVRADLRHSFGAPVAPVAAGVVPSPASRDARARAPAPPWAGRRRR